MNSATMMFSVPLNKGDIPIRINENAGIAGAKKGKFEIGWETDLRSIVVAECKFCSEVLVYCCSLTANHIAIATTRGHLEVPIRQVERIGRRNDSSVIFDDGQIVDVLSCDARSFNGDRGSPVLYDVLDITRLA